MLVGPHLLGAVLDGFGRVMQRGVAPSADNLSTVRVLAPAPWATERPPIDRHIVTGVRAIDALLTLARGQRVGIFAGPGCGKSTLLGALARGIDADIVVLGLVGERGRELNEFVGRELGPHKMQRTVVVCATSDAPAMARARAAFTATAIAEGFCNSGKHVLLLVDSLTRFARAQREIGLASNEPPGRLGYPPSVFSALPRLIERAGTRADGAITAVYTVLTETEHDPIADEARSLLDAHIVLSRKLAERGEFPAIDIVESLSRLMPVVASEPHRRDAECARTLLSRHRALEWLIALGEYEPGHDSAADDAVARHPKLAELVRQDLRTPTSWETTLDQLHDCVRGT
jgi:type III secretion protein N (ATPase)